MKKSDLKAERLEDRGFTRQKKSLNKFTLFGDGSIDGMKEPWWRRLLIRIMLPHKNKTVDKLLDMGCFVTLFIVVTFFVYVGIQAFKFIQMLMG